MKYITIYNPKDFKISQWLCFLLYGILNLFDAIVYILTFGIVSTHFSIIALKWQFKIEDK